MLQKLNSLDIKGNASKDPAYARQTCEAILSAVYSNNKDHCCKLLISKGVSITPFLKEIGEAAQNAGATWGDKKMVYLLQVGQGRILLSSPSLLQRALNIRICL
ncbi:guanine nucleotide exchange factor SopE [Salmonella enterica subsp. enterica serovar Daytona]|uniref:Guanine nucleotide exchange factor SopE n=1 Tax=Salmonella enterica subsp. enterica serovar Daytona TaxID=1962639 RepID=A0A447JJ88_SALET|nr:guanine nucleotide exchange factor SopE [Salmonella enterica subsp. enterica serovar Daytona]